MSSSHIQLIPESDEDEEHLTMFGNVPFSVPAVGSEVQAHVSKGTETSEVIFTVIKVRHVWTAGEDHIQLTVRRMQ